MNSLMCKIEKKDNNILIRKNIIFRITREDGKNGLLDKNGILIGFLGEIFEGDLSYELESIYQIYNKEGIDHLKTLNGLFSIIVVDFNKNTVSIIQDSHTYLEHIYYTSNGSSIFISNNIEEILVDSKLKRELNYSILPTYLHYSFVPSEQTLLKNVNKLPSGYILEYNNFRGEFLLRKAKCAKKQKNSDQSIIGIIDSALKKRIEHENEKVGFRLSGGFDSNLLLSRGVNLLKDKNLNVFSYGYDNEKSEIRSAEKVVELYRDKGYKVNHYKYFAKAEDIMLLPKIISFMQEPCLEPAAIFQYNLEGLTIGSGCKVLIGGDGNDEIYDRRVYYDMIYKMQEPIGIEKYPVYGRLRLGEFDRIHTYKYFTDIETCWILNDRWDYNELKLRLEVYSEVQKNYLITKRFFSRKGNVIVRLPYLDTEYTNYILNNLDVGDLALKNYQNVICKKYLPEDIYNELVNVTESTSPYSYKFLENDDIREKLFKLVLESNIMNEYFNHRAIRTLLSNFEETLNFGRKTNDYYKASVLTCRIFAILGFLVWYNIYIMCKSSELNLFEILKN